MCEWWEDPTEPEGYDPSEEVVTPKGLWQKEYRANRSHDCVRNSPYCPGEICPGEYYLRTAVLERPLGPSRRGTVTVTKVCQHCQ